MKRAVRKILKSFLFSLGPLFVIFIPYFLTRPWIWEAYVPRMYMGIGCGCLWLGMSPLLIELYKETSFQFFDAYEESRIAKNGIVDFRENFKKNFLKDRFFICFYLFWAVLVEAAIFSDLSYLERFGIQGLKDPYLYIFCISMLYVLLLTAAGFSGVFHTLSIVCRLISRQCLELEYLDADGIGGLKFVTDYILSTSRLFATGVLFIPIVMDYIYYTEFNIVRGLLYLIILVYGVAVVLLYLLPLQALYRYADNIKQDYLEDLRKRYYMLMVRLLEFGKDNNSEEELMALNIYNYIDMVERSSSFHVEHQVLSQVMQLVILPIASLLFNLSDIISLVQVFWFS